MIQITIWDHILFSYALLNKKPSETCMFDRTGYAHLYIILWNWATFDISKSEWCTCNEDSVLQQHDPTYEESTSSVLHCGSGHCWYNIESM